MDLDALWADALRELDREIAAARELLSARKLTVCLAGPAGSGRCALLGALRGAAAPTLPAEDPSELALWQDPEHPEVRFAIPPPYQDVDPKLRAQAERFVRDEADVVLLVLNANAGLSRQDREALDGLRATGKPYLVVLHKIDTLRPADRKVVIDDFRERLGLGDDPPAGASAATGEGIPDLVERLGRLLEGRGKRILLDRWRTVRDEEMDRVVAEAMSDVSGGGSLAAVAARCARAAVRLLCLGGREARWGLLQDALREAFRAPAIRRLAKPDEPGLLPPGEEERALAEATGFAMLQTARSLARSTGESTPARLQEIFTGRFLESRLRRTLPPGGGVDPGSTLDLLSRAMRAGDLPPERVAEALPRIKDLYKSWRAGEIAEAGYVSAVGALLAGEAEGHPTARPAPAPAPAAARASAGSGLHALPAPAGTPPAAPAAEPTLRQRAGKLVESAAGDLIESLWQARLRPKLEHWTEEQKAMLAADLLRIRAELEVDIDRKHGDLLKRTREEAEDFMRKAVATITAEAELAEKRARHRLWISSLFILAWAVLGLLYVLVRRYFGLGG